MSCMRPFNVWPRRVRQRRETRPVPTRRRTTRNAPLVDAVMPAGRPDKKGGPMLYYALIFFVVALIAAALGMRGVAGLSANIGYTLVFVALVFVVVALVAGHGGTPAP